MMASLVDLTTNYDMGSLGAREHLDTHRPHFARLAVHSTRDGGSCPGLCDIMHMIAVGCFDTMPQAEIPAACEMPALRRTGEAF